MTSNPLLHRGLPLFSQIKPEHIEPAITQVLSEVLSEFKILEKTSAKTWKGLLEPLSKLSLKIHYCWGPASHLHSVLNTPEIRTAYDKTLPKIIEISLSMEQSRPIYDMLLEIQSSPEWKTLERPQQRIISSHLRSMKQSGVSLDGSIKEKFNTIVMKLSELETQFSNHVLDATKSFQMVLTNHSEVAGLPDSYLASASQTYNQKNKTKESTPEKGPWLITLDTPSYISFMENSQNRALRQKLYSAYTSKASQGENNNLTLIQEILKLRHEKAKILDFKNFAALSLSNKMANHVQTVYELENSLLEVALPKAQEEFKELQAFAKAQNCSDPLTYWDIPYWAKRLEEKSFEYTEEELKPYFPLPQVLKGLFSLAKTLFQIDIQDHTQQVDSWHPDVRFFKIFETSQHIASFFLDPYTRPETKRGGAWMNDCIGKSRIDGEATLPVAYLVCNFTNPVGSEVSLLTFSEVETLFHEFGHGLQHMLTRVEVLEASGINNIEWDAVELPSQFMENWCYHKDTLLDLAKHYQTQETLPEHYFKKLHAAKNFRSASMLVRQIQFGLVDMELHDLYSGTSENDFLQFTQSVVKRTSVLPVNPQDRSLCGFTHIFAGGYSAGYYSYLWAEVLSSDAFSAFEEAGIDSIQNIKECGKRFRDTILALGGGEDPLTIFKKFRGKNPDPSALLRHRGLK